MLPNLMFYEFTRDNVPCCDQNVRQNVPLGTVKDLKQEPPFVILCI